MSTIIYGYELYLDQQKYYVEHRWETLVSSWLYLNKQAISDPIQQHI